MMELDDEEIPREPSAVYTRTIVQSPVVRWILQARLRSRRCQDVVFVGGDFVHVKQIGTKGQLHHIATKADFDARICAVTTFDNEDDSPTEDFLVKLELNRNQALDQVSDFPPQCLVLSLESNEVVFVYLRADEDGAVHFVQQSYPLPSFDRVIFQPGEHLAVDLHSRALAVAANEREVVLFAAKPKPQIQREMKAQSKDWIPVLSDRRVQIDGVVHHMDFLIPPADDMDHIILLLIVTDQGRTKAVRIDWQSSQELGCAELYSGHVLGSDHEIVSLLIPLRDAAFVMAVGNEFTYWEHILSGSLTSTTLFSPDDPSLIPGNSPSPPLWVNWSKPRRSPAARRDKDVLYLVREDGLVYLYQIHYRAATTAQSSNAGHLGCHVGTAFASLGDEEGPDILAVVGETCSGRVVSIGLWPTTRPSEALNRQDTMGLKTTQILTNWASVNDMMSGERLQSSRNKTSRTHNALVTSGRQPYGCITELRRGLEALLSVFTRLDDLRSVTDIWTVPDISSGSIVFVLSTPFDTKLYSATADLSEIEPISDVTVFDISNRTLIAGMTAHLRLVQVTSREICASSAVHGNFEDTGRLQFDADTAILVAALIFDSSVVVAAERDGTGHHICGYSLPLTDDASTIRQRFKLSVQHVPLCVEAVAVGGRIVVLAATDEGKLITILMDSTMRKLMTRERPLPFFDTSGLGKYAVCDNMVILHSPRSSHDHLSLLAVCGLRDGKIIVFVIDVENDLKLGDGHYFELGLSTVKLFRLHTDTSTALAMSGRDTYMLSWSGGDAQSLRIDNVWIADKNRPDFAQEDIVAAAQLPAAAYLAPSNIAESIVMISGHDLLVTDIKRQATTVPRQIPVTGTPNRVIFAESLRSIVCASRCTDIRSVPSPRPHAAPVERRQIWPVIDFIPSKGNKPSFSYEMQPGERVHALLEWSLRQGNEKTYSFIVVGGSYIGRSGSRKGRITFLQCSIRNWLVNEATEKRTETFGDEVSALASYDPMSIVACAGDYVYLYRLSEDDMKWRKLCLPYKLASAGMQVTVETDHNDRRIIIISTARDSFVTLILQEITTEGMHDAARLELHPRMLGQRADSLLHHLLLDVPSATGLSDKANHVLLTSNKHGGVLGTSWTEPSRSSTRHTHTGTAIFEAQLPHSLVRLCKVKTAPHRGTPPHGVIPQQVHAATTDGAMVGIVLLETHLWKRLFWLQRLVEWSVDLSPHSCTKSSYATASSSTHMRNGGARALPIGFDGTAGHPAILDTRNTRLQDFHIDGDILARVLSDGGEEAIKRVLNDLAQRDDDGVGQWVREHWDLEMGALDELVEIVKKLERWMR